jgi:hypothetical protein
MMRADTFFTIIICLVFYQTVFAFDTPIESVVIKLGAMYLLKCLHKIIFSPNKININNIKQACASAFIKWRRMSYRLLTKSIASEKVVTQ